MQVVVATVGKDGGVYKIDEGESISAYDLELEGAVKASESYQRVFTIFADWRGEKLSYEDVIDKSSWNTRD